MKRIISIVFALFLMMISVQAIADVSFNGIPFFSSDEEVLNLLIDKGLAKKNISSNLSNEKSTYLVANDLLGYQPTCVQKYQLVCFSQNIPGFGKIGAYPLKDLIFTYAYNGSYKFIAVKVELLGADYTTLFEKLKRVYGEPEIRSVEDEGITSNIWRDGDTAVVLYTESEGFDYTLMYGRLDAEEILANCLNIDPDDVSGL